jgi:hypothetical protein
MSQGTGIESNSEDINFSNRDILGFNFEVRIDNILKNMEINYISNPLQNMALWKRHQGIGSDFKIPSWNWELESKYSEAKIFPSWINRDWIPRFDKHSFKVIVHNKEMKLTNKDLELCFLNDIYLVEISFLKYVLKTKMKNNKVLEPNSSKSIEANKLLEGISSVLDGSLDSSKDDRTGKTEDESVSSETFRPKSPAFRDKFKLKVKELAKLVGETFKVGILNLLSWIKTLALSLWHDKCGNVSLTKRSWKSKGGFQVSENQIQTRLVKHSYPCKYKVQIICTKNRKIKYLCKASYRIDWNRLWFYNNMLYCKCHDIPEREGCIQHDAFCFYNMNRDLIDQCPWSRSRMTEKWMYEDSLKKKMKEEQILERINRNKIGMVKA